MPISKSDVWSQVFLSDRLDFIRSSKYIYECKYITGIRIFDIIDSERVCHDRHHSFFHRFFIIEYSDKVIIALRHFSPIGSRKCRKSLSDDRFWFDEYLFSVGFIEIPHHITRHLEVLYLIFPNWHTITTISYNICRHQNRIIKYSHINIYFFYFSILETMSPEHQ